MLADPELPILRYMILPAMYAKRKNGFGVGWTNRAVGFFGIKEELPLLNCPQRSTELIPALNTCEPLR